MQDKAQLRQMLSEVFSEAYTDEMLQEFFAPDAVCALRERDGKLYASENWLFRQAPLRQYTGKLTLIGRTENVISLQAELSYQGGTVQMLENYPLTLRREESGWKIDGWKSEMAADNSFVQLPPELEQAAGKRPGTCHLAAICLDAGRRPHPRRTALGGLVLLRAVRSAGKLSGAGLSAEGHHRPECDGARGGGRPRRRGLSAAGRGRPRLHPAAHRLQLVSADLWPRHRPGWTG